MASPYVTTTLVDTHANLPAAAKLNHIALVADDDGAGHSAIYRGNGSTWDLALSATSSGGLASFDTINNGGTRTLLGISAYEFAGLTSRSVVWVDSVKDWFQWEPTSADTADNITVVNPTTNGANPGRFRRANQPWLGWMDQFSWYVKPSTGNDENSGIDAAHPLASDDERLRRMGGDPMWRGFNTGRAYHIYYLESVTRCRLRVRRSKPGESTTVIIYVHGSATPGQGATTLYSGTIDNTPAQTYSTNTRWSITSNGLATAGGWTTQGLICASGTPGIRVRLTSGANAGAVMWAGKDAGAKTAFVNEPRGGGTVWDNGASLTFATCSPANGDAFVVEQLTSIGTVDIFAMSSSIIIFDSIVTTAVAEIRGASISLDGSYVRWGGRPAFGQAARIRYNGSFLEGASSTNSDWPIAEAINLTNCAQIFGLSMRCLAGGTVMRHVIFGQIAGQLGLDGPKAVVGTDDVNANAGILHSKGWAVFSIGQFDNPGSMMLLVLSSVLFVDTTVLWGSGNSFGPVVLLSGAIINRAGGAGDGNDTPLPASWFYYDLTGGLTPWACLTAVGQIGDGRQTGHSCPAWDPVASAYTEPRNITQTNLNATVAAGGFNGQFADPLTGCKLLHLNQG